MTWSRKGKSIQKDPTLIRALASFMLDTGTDQNQVLHWTGKNHYRGWSTATNLD